MKIKLIVIAVSVLSGGIAGVFGGIKMAKDPICNCPEIKIPKCPPAYRVQAINFDKLRKAKGNVTVTQEINGDVYMTNCPDTTKTN